MTWGLVGIRAGQCRCVDMSLSDVLANVPVSQ